MPQVKPSVTLIEYTSNPERTVAVSAKLCYSNATIDDLSESLSDEQIARFIKNLMNFGHFSPIEHASFTFGVEGVSRSLLAQITRHRIASFSVKSQRYTSCDDMNFIIPPAIEKLGEQEAKLFADQMQTMQDWYKQWQQKLGGNKESSNEDARFVLPNACETKFTLTMNARELLGYFALRCCFRAQWEIREVSWQMLKLVQAIAPNIFANAGPGCLKGVCPEGKMCCGKMAEVKQIKANLV